MYVYIKYGGFKIFRNTKIFLDKKSEIKKILELKKRNVELSPSFKYL